MDTPSSDVTEYRHALESTHITRGHQTVHVCFLFVPFLLPTVTVSLLPSFLPPLPSLFPPPLSIFSISLSFLISLCSVIHLSLLSFFTCSSSPSLHLHFSSVFSLSSCISSLALYLHLSSYVCVCVCVCVSLSLSLAVSHALSLSLSPHLAPGGEKQQIKELD